MFSVLAVSAPTSTREPALKRMPLGLINTICPLADSELKIALGSGPSTRFNAIEAAVGCWKRTDSLAAILKRVQSTITRSVVCSIRIDVLVGVLMVAEHVVTF